MLSRTKAMGANGSQNISVIHIFIYLTIYLSILQFKPIRPSRELQQNYHNVQCEETYIKQKLKLPFKTPTEWLRCYQIIFVRFPVLDLVQS